MAKRLITTATQDGKELPVSPDEVKRIVESAMGEGEIVAVVMMHHDDIMLRVFMAPSEKIAGALELAAEAVRTALKKAGH